MPLDVCVMKYVDTLTVSCTLLWHLILFFSKIFSGNIPFHELFHDCAVLFKVLNGIRPSRPTETSMTQHLDNDIWRLIETCWSSEPNNRPRAFEVVQFLLPRLTQQGQYKPGTIPLSLDYALICWSILSFLTPIYCNNPRHRRHREPTTILLPVKTPPWNLFVIMMTNLSKLTE